MAIDWTRGYSATFRLYEVDPDTWADAGRLYGATSASVERTDDGDAPELESSSVEIDDDVGTGFRERLLRLVMIAVQDGARERVDVCTQRYAATSGKTHRGYRTRSLKGRSVLHAAATSTTAMVYGPYVPAGSDGALEVARMLRAAGVGIVNVEGSFLLDEPYVFDRSENVLKSAWAILRAGGYRICIDGRGTVTVLQRAESGGEPALDLSGDLVRLVIPGIGDELDWSDIPNRYIAVDGSDVATVVNDDPLSLTSTVTRGHYVDRYDSSPIRINGESLEAYATRRLAEESIATDSRDIEREWWPGVYPGDLVRASLPRDGMQGEFRVRRQSLRCGAGIVVTERSEREVVAWPVS